MATSPAGELCRVPPRRSRRAADGPRPHCPASKHQLAGQCSLAADRACGPSTCRAGAPHAGPADRPCTKRQPTPLGPVPGWPGGDIGAGAVWVPAMPLIPRVCDTVYYDKAVPRRGRPEVESPALRSATRPSLGRPTSSHLPGPARARQARRRGRRGPVSPTYMGLIKTSPSLFQF